MGPTPLCDKRNSTASPCEVCGYTSKPGNTYPDPEDDNHPVFNILEVTETPEILVINYKCPSCSGRMGDVFQPDVVRMKDVLARMMRELIKQMRDVKEELIEKKRLETISIRKMKTPSSTETKDTKEGNLKTATKRERPSELDIVQETDKDKQPCSSMSFNLTMPVDIGEMGIGDTPVPETTGVADKKKKHYTIIKMRRYRCSYCPRLFKFSFQVKDHIQRIHDKNPDDEDDKNLVCSFLECGKQFKGKTKSERHVRRKHTDILKCPDCPDVLYTDKKSYERHRIAVHQVGDWPYLCQRCGMGFTDMYKLRGHEDNRHSEEIHVCRKEGCGKEFSSRRKFDSHLQLHKKGIESLKCSKCPKQFDNYHSFRTHEQTHREIFSCPEPGCGKKFGFSTRLKDHIETHNDQRKYVCEKCGKGFKTRKLKYSHVRYVHPEEPFRCEECPDVYFKMKVALDSHLISVHEIGEWPFPCPIVECGKGFFTQHKLQTHMDIKHCEGNQICSYEGCGKHFKNLRCLKAHQVLHEKGIDSLKCEKCGKEYTNYKSFKAHQRLHEQSEKNKLP